MKLSADCSFKEGGKANPDPPIGIAHREIVSGGA